MSARVSEMGPCNMHCLWIIVLINMHLISGKSISKSCWDENGVVVQCKCIGNEELLLPGAFDYTNLTRLSISSCVTVSLKFSNLQQTKFIRDITVENITGTLLFHPMPISKYMGTFEIKNVEHIPLIPHHMFSNVMSIDTFFIENTRIENFDETFQGINITNLIIRNVTIDHTMGMNLLVNAKSLKIIDTVIRNVTGNFHFGEFKTIELVNSTFEFQKPGEMSLHGLTAKINNCTFYNISGTVNTKRNIEMKNNCADGKSSLRLDSKLINCHGNRFPTEITLTTSNTTEIMAYNNTVCIAANCKCPRSFQRSSQGFSKVNVHLGFICIFLAYWV